MAVASGLTETEFQIVLALAGSVRHGYGIMQQVTCQSGGHVIMGPGTLYGAVKRLLAGGLIAEGTPPRGTADDVRRTCYYRLTPAGRAAASKAAQQMADLVSVAAAYGLINPNLTAQLRGMR
jgi:DNA-binding PadR family transcriptional regulator